jgi:hypothetical protein
MKKSMDAHILTLVNPKLIDRESASNLKGGTRIDCKNEEAEDGCREKAGPHLLEPLVLFIMVLVNVCLNKRRGPRMGAPG